ncbi:UDP-glucose 4-epimerase GalE [Sphingopyxis terrae]|uniref:UDP-glucose 4-epimerase GalE n=1 Tax=Sphingopyxis terrae TaxID=33052 RepID=UPI00078787F1|nr:UDP-glucose 4-epimerase GalE [Sphingopyxis terrae]
MKVFVTGGAGYIGSHTLVQLLAAGHEVCVFDNFANSSPVALDRVRQLTNRGIGLVEADIRDADALRDAVTTFAPDAVMHFAGLKAVGESSSLPLLYYQTNVSGTMNLLAAMDAAGCKRIVFSSSATVYGEAHYLPFDEDHPIAPTNPYGRTKAMAEGIIGDWAKATAGASAVLLRYFNPVGAHESGRIGEDPRDIPNNLMPFVAQVAVGRRDRLSIFGDDYDTRDGTGERDYINVVDLAAAHLAAIEYASRAAGCEAINVGTGRGITVKELVAAYERACGRTLPVEIASRRPGDVASSYAATVKARDLLGWNAVLDIDAMCASSWLWQSTNPDGYGDRQ